MIDLAPEKIMVQLLFYVSSWSPWATYFNLIIPGQHTD